MANDSLLLPQVTLCAVTSVNVEATLRALGACLDQIAFGDCVLFTDQPVQPDRHEIRVASIPRLGSSGAYSEFLLSGLVDHVATPHCLVVQWDGHVVDARRWRPEFLDYDYVGARWPQFVDGHDVGNGGFSLRSRRLMEACRAPEFMGHHPEDVAIGRTNRGWLEMQGFKFAPAVLADRFAAERAGDPLASFGYHGVWNMPRALGAEAFWQIYCELDERGSVWTDLASLLRDVAASQNGRARAAWMVLDRLWALVGRGALSVVSRAAHRKSIAAKRA